MHIREVEKVLKITHAARALEKLGPTFIQVFLKDLIQGHLSMYLSMMNVFITLTFYLSQMTYFFFEEPIIWCSAICYKLTNWRCSENCMKFNASKYYSMVFGPQQNPLSFKHFIDGVALRSIPEIRGLGEFSHQFSFTLI